MPSVPEDVVLIVDDVLATGGTAAAKGSARVKSTGATGSPGYAFLIELDFLGGQRPRWADAKIMSLIHVRVDYGRL
jgi:adenine/guanine phosphoribosyltransferase-like PRPP-binding protein